MIFTIRFTLDSFGNLTDALKFPLPTKPNSIIIQQTLLAGEQLLHQGFFLFLAVSEQLFGGGDGLIPRGEDLGDFLLFGKWRNWDLKALYSC